MAPAPQTPSSSCCGGEPLLLLASASPRRADLLTRAGIPFEVSAVDVDETHPGPPREAVRDLARRKALSAPAGRHVLAADTLVVADGETLGKPRDAASARIMLNHLAGRTHVVLTGVCVRDPSGGLHEGTEATRVTLAPLSAEAIAAYVAGGEPLGKAGAYAIQGAAEAYVERLEGSWSNVVGLPLALTVRLLARSGFTLPAHLAPATTS